jgi:hypothetical protein
LKVVKFDGGGPGDSSFRAKRDPIQHQFLVKADLDHRHNVMPKAFNRGHLNLGYDKVPTGNKGRGRVLEIQYFRSLQNGFQIAIAGFAPEGDDLAYVMGVIKLHPGEDYFPNLILWSFDFDFFQGDLIV